MDPKDENAVPSYHAQRRFKERVGLPPRAARAAAKKALTLGLPPGHPDLDERARKVIAAAKRNNPNHRTGDVLIRAYKDHVYVYAATLNVAAAWVLLTILNVERGPAPEKTPEHAERLRKRGALHGKARSAHKHSAKKRAFK